MQIENSQKRLTREESELIETQELMLPVRPAQVLIPDSSTHLVQSSPTPVVEDSLVDYVASFGLQPQELSARDWLCFHAARKLAPYVDDIELPVATESRPSGEKIQVEKKVRRIIEETEYVESLIPFDQPTNTFDVVGVKDPTDLRSLLATQWLLEDIAPEQFYRSLSNRELLRTEWQDAEKNPIKSERVIEASELVWESAPPSIRRPNAYTLIDCSPSMDDADGRGIAGAGLSIAFLKKAFDKGAKMFASTFSDDARPPVSGTEKEDLRSILRVILGANNGRGTDIERALQTAVRQIEKQGNDIPSDILLITDGESKLDRNPLGQVKLHVLLVGTDFSDESAAEGHKKLKRWSTTFKRITEQFDTIPLEHKDIEGISKATDLMTGELAGQGSAGAKAAFEQSGALLHLLNQNSKRPTQESEQLKKKLQLLRHAAVIKHESELKKESIQLKKAEQLRKAREKNDLDKLFDEEANKPVNKPKANPVKAESKSIPDKSTAKKFDNSIYDLLNQPEISWFERIKNWVFGRNSSLRQDALCCENRRE